ncbi:thioredoxin [Aestuariibacter salexigens]|uniref:thioredoxin n=1 Tax=Aestuariibacter salexigens TaxID=226010 RepID=UPI000425AE59|nr:thioredoxin [Aestuariibacter salexigens]
MQNIIDMTLENFQQVIMHDSQQKLVMVDFWADWCEPCKNLMPVLEKLAQEYSEHLLLAKVNCDEQQEIAAQFGVRSLPTVMLVKDGQPLDGFAGAQPESAVREMLEKHLPKPEDGLLQQAQELVSAGDYANAFGFAKQAYDLNADNVDIKYVLADCYIETGRLEEAKGILDTIGLVDQDGRYASLRGKIELAEQAADTPEIQALQEQLEANPDDMQLKVDLAVQLQQVHKVEEAIALLIEVLKKDLNFGDAKKLTLDVINALPDGDPLKSSSRRKLYSLLY